ncbi:sodium:proton antiporter [Lactobacillus curvatus]|nr:sodium:proton antiporter [Latilactobacillus curvatus]MSE24237.1 sodium:proton antiporter [Latilactobacillus curvatus]
MNLLISTLVIMLTVAISNIIARYVKGIASTYINLLLGIIIAIVPWTNQLVLAFDNDVFMIMILAPLLFFEGQTTPLLMVGKKLQRILGVAVVLAIVSAALATVFTSQLLMITLPIMLTIAAIATPTDATAFDAVVEGRKISQAIRNILKMESLFNDATGIILLQAGILWLTTGRLSFWQNTVDLFKSAVGGAALGAALAFLLMTLRQYFVRSTYNVISSQTLFYLLTPFCVYFVAEEVGVSGIIAVVTAGLVHNSEANRSRFSSPRQMHLGLQLSNFGTEILNGAVFVILGISLARIFHSQTPILFNSAKWLVVGVAVYGCLLVCRYGYARLFIGDHQHQTAILFALGGVHGTVTLAMTFSIANQVDSQLFNFVMMVETVVIILSMLVPTILFKWLLPIDGDAAIRAAQLAKMRNEMVAVGIESLESLTLSPTVKSSVLYDLHDQIQQNTLKSFFKQWHGFTANKTVITNLQSVEQRRALMQAFDAERDYLYGLAKNHLVSSDYVYEIYSEILLAESLVLDPRNQMI